MLKRASDFRAAAREALRGNWGIAIVAGLLATLLGGVASNTSGSGISINLPDVSETPSSPFPEEVTRTELLAFLGIFAAVFAVVFVIVIVVSLCWSFFGAIIGTGYAAFNLEMIDGQSADLATVFKYFPSWKNVGLSGVLRYVYVFLWSLLLIIPGIIASYSYAMTPYILAENPKMGANEAITRSKEMMKGKRWNLFCLEFSFIGWSILCAFTCGIGNLWLTPYMNAARADFYREVSDTRPDLKPFEPATDGAQVIAVTEESGQQDTTAQ